MTSKLESLQAAVLAQLQAESNLSGSTFTAYQRGDIQQIIEAAAAPSAGQSLVVMPPVPTRVRNHVGLVFEEVQLTVRVYDAPWAEEGTTPLAVAEAVALALHGWSPGEAGFTGHFQLKQTNPWKVIESKHTSALSHTELTFYIGGGLQGSAA